MHGLSPSATAKVTAWLVSSLDFIHIKDTGQRLMRISVIEKCVCRNVGTQKRFTFAENSIGQIKASHPRPNRHRRIRRGEADAEEFLAVVDAGAADEEKCIRRETPLCA